MGAHRHWLESDVASPLLQRADDGVSLLRSQRRRPSLHRGQDSGSERQGNMGPILRDLTQDGANRIV